MIAPHGGTLVEGYADAEQAQAIREEAESLPSVALNPRQLSDAHMIAQGAFSPLTGFMGHEDYTAVVKTMHLADGQPWSLPDHARRGLPARCRPQGREARVP